MQKDITEHMCYESVAGLVRSLKRLQKLTCNHEVQTDVIALKVHAAGWEYTDPVLMRSILNTALFSAEIVYGLDMDDVIAMQECLDKAI